MSVITRPNLKRFIAFFENTTNNITQCDFSEVTLLYEELNSLCDSTESASSLITVSHKFEIFITKASMVMSGYRERVRKVYLKAFSNSVLELEAFVIEYQVI